MKKALLFVSFFLPALAFLRAENAPATNDRVIAAVRAADDARVAATVAGDRAKMNAVYSNDLRYAHSTGKVDNKAAYIEALVTREAIYTAIDYQERNFVQVAPTIVLMNGRGIFKVATGGQRQDLDLRFLGVWREEQGTWRLVAWQSNRQPAAPATK
jgi:ketosteroid isomerase-like protein